MSLRETDGNLGRHRFPDLAHTPSLRRRYAKGKAWNVSEAELHFHIGRQFHAAGIDFLQQIRTEPFVEVEGVHVLQPSLVQHLLEDFLGLVERLLIERHLVCEFG